MFSKIDKFLHFLDIGYWNIQGLFYGADNVKIPKYLDSEFKQTIINKDIFALAECHTGPDVDIPLDNFTSYSLSREKSSNNRFLGG